MTDDAPAGVVPDHRSHIAYLKRRARDAAKLAHTDDPGMAPTVDALALEWTRHRVKAGLVTPRTGRYQRGELERFRAAHGKDRTMRADRRVFDRWLESMGHLSASTRRVHTSTIRGFVSWAIDQGHIHQRALMLIPKVRQPRAVPRAFNADQSARLVLSLADEKQRAVVGLMLWCGLRRGEVASLKVQDVDERGATLFVIGKGQHERVVPIPVEFVPHLTAWLDYRRRVPGPLFPSVHGRHYDPSTIGTLVAKWMRSANVKVAAHDGRSAHSLRHTCASDVLDGGAPVTAVMQMLGHQHLSTTATYLRRANLGDLRRAMDGRNYDETTPPVIE